jgi:hypothetical protein
VPYDFFSFFSPASIYCLTHVGYSVSLVSVIPGLTWDPERQWKLQRAMREAVLDIRQAHPDWLVPPPAAEATTSAPIVAPPHPGQDNGSLQAELEAIFNQANSGVREPGEADAFWESALDQSASFSGGADGISFEQARQMGLAPKDD